MCRHAAITEKMLRQPFYYDKWFRCKNTQCGTTLIMLEEHKVWRDQPSEVGEPLDDVVLQVLEEMSSDESIPPWEGEDQFVAVRRPPQ